jgi:hypothetical protein
MAPNTTGASARHQNNDREWREGIQRIHDEASGLLDINLIDADAGLEMILDAALGNIEAATLMRAVWQAAARIKEAPRRTPTLCLCCPRAIKRLTPGTVFGVARPSTAKPSNALAFAFCDRCSADRGTLAAKAATGLRRIWPDLRPITVTHGEAGHA